MVNVAELGYRLVGAVWAKPVEIHDTTLSGDKRVDINVITLFAFVPTRTVGFYIQNGSLRVRGAVNTAEEVACFEQFCLGIKHWFYILPQIKQFQDDVKNWAYGGKQITFGFNDLREL